MAGETHFCLLGSLAVTVNGHTVTVPGGRQRVILAGLLLRANTVVRLSEVKSWLWDGDAPGNAGETAQAYVRRVRQTLGTGDLITTVPHGYRIDLAPGQLDLFRFRELVARADLAEDHSTRSALLAEGLGEWRGLPLADIPAGTFRDLAVERLTEEWLRAVEQRMACELALGRHAEVVPELADLAARHPLREGLHAQLMTALYRADRQVEALNCYQEIRRKLAEEFGVDPGDELRRLQQSILTNDPALNLAAPQLAGGRPRNSGSRGRGHPVPAQLPSGIRDFIGREEVVDEVVGVLAVEGGQGVPVAAISGQPGIGKTALAIQIAHRLRDRFPDGQLFVDLRGDAQNQELAPEQVLARFLQSLGMPPEQVPTGIADLVAAYRTALADRRVLAVLDNASSAEQVRSLLPGLPGSAVLVTSRQTLRSLAALDGARLVSLDVLTPAQSMSLLKSITGSEHAAPEAAALAEIAELCGHLPLALRIAGANMLLRNDGSVHAYLADLRHGNRLTALEIEGDPNTAVRAVFDLSYLALKPEAARLSRFLGLVPGADFDRELVAVLAGLPPEQTTRLLAHLATASLVQSPEVGRFRLHDLLRLYMRERCGMEDSPAEILAARTRLFAYYVQRADAVADMLYPTWMRLPRTPLELEAPATLFENSVAAIEWMDREGLNVIAAATDAARSGPAHAAWHLAESLRAYLVTRGRYRAEAMVSLEVVLRSAKNAADASAEAAVHNVLASVHLRSQNNEAALRHALSELEAHTRSGSHEGRGRSLITIGNVYEAMENLNVAAETVERGVSTAEEHGFGKVRLYGLVNLAFIEEQRGRLDVAERYARTALRLVAEHPNAVAEAALQVGLGHIKLRQQFFDEAIGHYAAALARYRETGTRHYEAETLHGLTEAYRQAGRHGQALDRALEALRLSEDSGVEPDRVDSLITTAVTYRTMNDHHRANDHIERALELAQGLGYRRGQVRALLVSAELLRDEGALADARDQGRRAAEISRDNGLLGSEGASETLLAWLALDAGEARAADEHASRAVAVQRQRGALLEEAKALHARGCARDASGAREEARASWQQALDRVSHLSLPDVEVLTGLLAGS